jgi:hypothetical protein
MLIHQGFWCGPQHLASQSLCYRAIHRLLDSPCLLLGLDVPEGLSLVLPGLLFPPGDTHEVGFAVLPKLVPHPASYPHLPGPTLSTSSHR